MSNNIFSLSSGDASPATPSAPVWHGYAGFLLQMLHCAVMIGFTKPRSILRPASFSLQLLITYALYRSNAFDHLGKWLAFFAMFVVYSYPVEYLDKVLLRGYAFEARGPTRSPTRSFESGRQGTTVSRLKNKTSAAETAVSEESVWSRLLFGLKITTSARHPGTPYEVKNCPHWSEKDMSYAPTRISYLIRTLVMVVFGLALIDFQFASRGLNPNKPVPKAFEAPFLSRLGEVTVKMIRQRLVTTAVVWISISLSLQATYRLRGLVFVSLGLSEPREFPPLYGPLSELYSVRKFWGTVWHQLLRNDLYDPATFLAHDVLGLPTTGLAQRYFKIFVAFAISGALHAMAETTRGISLKDQGAVRFFCTQTLGIMIEDGFQEVWRRLFGDAGSNQRVNGSKSGPEGSKHARPAVWKRVVGFLWLWAFMAWTTPSWIYPKMAQKMLVLERAFPWSLAEKVLGVERDFGGR